MRHLLIAALLSPSFASLAYGVAARPLAETLAEAAPDQETFFELTAPEPDDDADDRLEEDEERVARISELERAAKATAAAGSHDFKRAVVLYELAQLHQARALYVRDLAVETYRADFDKWWIGEALSAPELKLDAWKEELLKSINVLRDLAANFRKDPRSAEIHWLIASSMARLGNDHCEQYFKLASQLAKDPAWADRVRISRADWLVSRGKLDEAASAYGELRTSLNDELKPYATYRLAWTYLAKANLPTLKGGDQERSELTKKAEAALKLAFLAVPQDGDTRFKLRHAAATDLAWMWAARDHTEAETEAATFFEKHDAKAMMAVLKEKQAEEWLRRGQVDRAAAYYRAKVQADPEDPRRPDYHVKLAFAYVVAGNVQAVKQETEALGKLTTDAEGPWLDEHESDEVLVGRAKRMHALLPLVAGLKLFGAAEALKDEKRKKELLTAAVTSLQEQLKTLTDPDQALTIRIMVVRAMISLARHLEALDQLDQIVKLGRKAGPQLAGAAFERLNILVKLDEDSQHPALPPPGEVKKAIPLPPLKQRFAKAVDEYLQIVPDAEILPNLRFQVAHDLFSYGHYDDALTRFETFVEQFPRHEHARSAIEICLSMNLKRQNWEELVRLSTTFLNNRNVKGRDLRNYVKENLDWAREQVKTKAAGSTVH